MEFLINFFSNYGYFAVLFVLIICGFGVPIPEDITLVINGKETAVKVQAMQRHPFKPKLVHIDFKRV